MRILATGFGPFPGVPFNVSAALVRHLAAAVTVPVELTTAILPVEWHHAADENRRLIREAQPHAIVHFGVSREATGFVIERRAVNLACRRADQRDAIPSGHYLRRGAPPVLKPAFAVEKLVRHLRLAGLSAAVSDDAGRYLCNAVYYETLHHAAQTRSVPLAVFIHIPVLSEAAVADAAPEWRALVTGAAIILRFAAGHMPPAHRAGFNLKHLLRPTRGLILQPETNSHTICRTLRNAPLDTTQQRDWNHARQ